MTGEELYEVYKRKCAEQGVGIDDWDELPPEDREAWEETANEVCPN